MLYYAVLIAWALILIIGFVRCFKPSKILNIAIAILFGFIIVSYILKGTDYSDILLILALGWSVLFPSTDTEMAKNYYKLKFEMTELAKKYGETDKIIYNVSEEDINKLNDLLKDGKKVDAAKLLKVKYNMFLTEAVTYIDCLKNSKYYTG